MACDAPLSIRYDPPLPDGSGGLIYYFPADCGKCLPCLKKRKQQWSYRLTEEKRNSFSSYFVTLTYSDEFVPIGDGVLSSNKNDHINFIKKLKKSETKKELNKRTKISMEEFKRSKEKIKSTQGLRYFGVSEYGERFGRPHWHYLLFNIRDTDNIFNAWTVPVYDKNGTFIEDRTIGKVQIDECNTNTIDYVLKYMLKYKPDKDLEVNEKEKAYFSKGLGKDALTPEIIEHIRRPDGNQVINLRGNKIPVPRYYRKKHLSDMDREKQNIYISQRIKEQEIKEDNKYLRAGLSPDKFKQDGKEARLNYLKIKQNRNL